MMARYFRQDISHDGIVPKPALSPLEGLRLARRAPLVAAMRAQDRVVSLSRRVVLRCGRSGANNWLVPNTDPYATSQTHPLLDVARTVARARVTLTPGCMLELRAIVGLSGMAQRLGVGGEVTPPFTHVGIGQGEIRVQTTWDDGGATVSRTFSKALPSSMRAFGAAPTAQGGQFVEERVVRIPLIYPQDLKSTTALNRWSQPTVVTLTVQYVGGARVQDLCIAERPYAVAMESDDATWTSHVLGPTPDGTAPAIDYPYQRLSETSPDGNPRGGTWQLMDVANNQAERLGPCLLSWSAWDEDGEAVSATDTANAAFSSTTFAMLGNASLSTYSADQEGWSFAAGAYARRRRDNDPDGMPYNGVLPIRVRVYCQGNDGSGNSGGIVRVQSSPYEWVDVDVVSGAAAGWVTAFGYARVGTGPGDLSNVQVFARKTTASGNNGIRVFAVEVHHSDQFSTPL